MGGKRRHWIYLNENYLIIPISTNGSEVTWSVTYRYYMEFTQQKKVLFTWNIYPGKTSGVFKFVTNYFPNWNYFPGGITSFWDTNISNTAKPGGYEFYYKVGLDGVTYTPAVLYEYEYDFGTVDATHPTYTIYRSYETNNIFTSGNLGSSIILKTAQLRLYVRSQVFDVGEQYEDLYNTF